MGSRLTTALPDYSLSLSLSLLIREECQLPPIQLMTKCQNDKTKHKNMRKLRKMKKRKKLETETERKRETGRKKEK